ncbi:glycosyltransferase family 2 protein [Clostridium perfringens]|nr:glycosyltransferase family 2 protein [Clostridium perfringens]EJT5920942.1 glycosyltransferase family 2 protein [Clostridium perfringens]
MIIACIVTYNPEMDRLKKNLESIHSQLDDIIIIDNNSSNLSELDELLNNMSIKIIKNKENFGIAKALNIGIDYAKKNGFKWILTLDQDSICEKNFIKKYKSYLKNSKENIIILTPSINDINLCNTIEFNSVVNEEVRFAITSGSLISIEKALEIGKYNENLFIDYVDFEFCLRAILKEYKIIRLNNVRLLHELGVCKEKNILGKKFIITNHSALRRYYLYRNKMFIYRKYFNKFPEWVVKDIFSSLKTILLILFFEEKKFDKTKYIFKGIKDGILM